MHLRLLGRMFDPYIISIYLPDIILIFLTKNFSKIALKKFWNFRGGSRLDFYKQITHQNTFIGVVHDSVSDALNTMIKIKKTEFNLLKKIIIY